MFDCASRDRSREEISSLSQRQQHVNNDVTEIKSQLSGLRSTHEKNTRGIVELRVEMQQKFQQQTEVIANLQAKLMHLSEKTIASQMPVQENLSREALQGNLNEDLSIASEMHGSGVKTPGVSPPMTPKVDAAILGKRDQREKEVQSQLVLEGRIDKLTKEFTSHSSDVHEHIDRIERITEILTSTLDRSIQEMRNSIEDVKSMGVQKTRLDELVPLGKPMQVCDMGDKRDIVVAKGSEHEATINLPEFETQKDSSIVTELDDVVPEYPEFEFAESLWDAALFLGGDAFGIAASLHTFFLLLLTAVVQLVYAYIISKSFTQSDFSDDTISDLERWRVNAAQAYANVQEITFQSLATRVCNGDGSLEIAGAQRNKLSAIRGYMPENADDFFGDKRGQIMCTLSVLVWSLAVAKELKDVALHNLSVATHVLDNGLVSNRLRLSQLEYIDGTWTIERFCLVRVVLTALLSAFRIFIAIFLYVAGIQYLVHTISLRDLVLNAVALECVLLLDEYMFEALAPWRVSSVMRNLAPLTMPKRCIWRGLDVVAICLLVAVAVCLGIGMPSLLDIEVGQLLKARDAMCGGNTNFVYSRTHMAPFFAYAPANNGSIAGLRRDYRIVQDIIKGSTEYVNLNVGQLFGGAWSLEELSSWSVTVGTSKLNNLCGDLFQEGPLLSEGQATMNDLYQGMAEQYMGHAVPGQGKITSCNAPIIKRNCDYDDIYGRIARVLCPRTCGCHLPDTKLVMTAPKGGCAVQCSTRPEYLQALANISCVDKTMVELQNDELWKYQAEHIVMIANASYPPDPQGLAGYIREKMLNEGCGAVAALSAIGDDLCSESPIRAWPFRSLRRFCPVACNCSSEMLNCPGTCPRSTHDLQISYYNI